MSTTPTSNSTEDPEASLVAGIAAGSRECESEFVARYLPKVRTLLLIRSRNPELTKDLQQDVMIEALCALRKGQLRDAERLAAFVAGITRNLLNNHYRGQTRAPIHEELPPELPDTWEENPLDSQESIKRRQMVDQALAALDSTDRTILQMTLVDDLKPGVIADRLNLSPEVVRQRKLRATRRVMESVQQMSQSRSTAHIRAGDFS